MHRVALAIVGCCAGVPAFRCGFSVAAQVLAPFGRPTKLGTSLLNLTRALLQMQAVLVTTADSPLQCLIWMQGKWMQALPKLSMISITFERFRKASSPIGF
eukprot:5584374-Amphidinium_carterae.1